MTTVRSLLQKLTGSLKRQEAASFSFFRQWSAGEQAEIQKGGKIPDLHRWCDVAAADDMMTQAALQSFAVDQGELDDRIARLMAG